MFYIDNDINTVQKYDMIKFMNFDEDNCDPLSSFIINNISKLPEQGKYQIKNSAGRPDTLSYKLYADTQYWWILLLYNNINNIKELEVGTWIIYPSLDDIQNLYIQATTLKKTEGNS